ncbi:MAG: tetratricopeptide repeat protein, partial [Bacteroidota bacterium]
MRRNIISLLFILSFACSNEKTPVFQTNEENISLKDRHLKTNDNYFFLTKAHDAYINYKVDDAYDELLRLDSIHLEKPLNDSNWVNAQILKGKCLLKFRKYEEADQVFNDLTDNSKRLTYSQKADIESNIGSLLLLKEEFERAEEQYKKAIDLYYLHQDTLNHQLAITYNNMGYLCDLLVRYPEAISYYRKAQSKWELLHDTLHADLAHPYGNIGLVYEKMGLFKEARGLQEKALDIRMKTIPNHDFITYGLNNIGLLLIKEGDYETALHYFEKALSSSQINHNYFLNNIGLAYSKMNEHQKASEYFVRAHEIEKETFTSEHPIFADTYYNFAVEYRELGNYEKALQYLERSLNQRKRSPSSIEMGLISYHNEKALLFLLQKDTSKAIYHYKKSLKAAKNLFGQIHPDVSDAYYFLAKVSFEQKDLVSAKYYANKAAEAINGSDEEVESISDFQLVQILILKGDIEKERDESRLNSINYYKRALNLAEKLIESYMEQSSRQQLKEGIFGVYEKLIDANLYLHQRTDSLIYYEQAFQFAEESKAYRLKEAFNSINARKRTNIPDEILRKEEQLKFQLSQIKEERRKLNLNIEEEKESILIGTIFDLTQKLDSIKQIFKTNYPAYYKLKYNKKVISISEIQNQLLSNDKTLVEYFVGKDKIYIFIIQQAHHYVYEVPIDFPLQNWIKQMNKGVQGDFSNTPNKNIDYPLVYAQSAFNLQKKLIAPLLPLLSKESTIIFVKDGALNYLPFNILLLEKPIDPYEFRTHHYLFKDYNISNAYSATLLSQMKQKEHLKPTTNELLVFAPNFSDSINLVS